MIEQLLLWPPGPLPPAEADPPIAAVSAQAYGLNLAAQHQASSLWQPLAALLSGERPCCLALGLDPQEPPSPGQQQELLTALGPWLRQAGWFAPWQRPLLLVRPLADPQAQAFWLARLRATGAQLLELHNSRPSLSQADGVVLLHPYGEPHLPDHAPAELLALQSNSYGPLGPLEHRAVAIGQEIAWTSWRANALANTALNAHHRPGLVVLQLQQGWSPLPKMPEMPPEPVDRPCRPRSPLQRAFVLHAFHADLVEPILQRLEGLLASESAPLRQASALFVTCPDPLAAALQQRLARFPAHHQLAVVGNHGRDLLPFLLTLPELVARRVELVVKLHTKRSSHLQPGSLVRVRDGEAWRAGLLDGLLEPARLAALSQQLQAAGEQPCLTAPEPFLWPVEVSMGPSAARLEALLAELGLSLAALRGRRFAAGSMWACNRSALIWLQQLQLGPHSFELEDGALDGGTGHALERLLALLVPQGKL